MADPLRIIEEEEPTHPLPPIFASVGTADPLIHDTMRALYDFADDHKETVFPGFTHLQIAQPVVLGHHVLAYLEKIKGLGLF